MKWRLNVVCLHSSTEQFLSGSFLYAKASHLSPIMLPEGKGDKSVRKSSESAYGGDESRGGVNKLFEAARQQRSAHQVPGRYQLPGRQVPGRQQPWQQKPWQQKPWQQWLDPQPSRSIYR